MLNLTCLVKHVILTCLSQHAVHIRQLWSGTGPGEEEEVTSHRAVESRDHVRGHGLIRVPVHFKLILIFRLKKFTTFTTRFKNELQPLQPVLNMGVKEGRIARSRPGSRPRMRACHPQEIVLKAVVLKMAQDKARIWP